ncbi:MAG: DNA primase catalytic subunit PriS [Candidatus Methanoliparum thermophilum]|uniref:DNA primase small subunit PriS n=1 Tax=Methanoliparum thermophilum TaxID=2491083 RepID=A0A520KQH5_METT2|nr:MAG: DNA primase catalytic subunit PriS [Candidatus Methanoliparum thermophilum]
MDMNEVSTIYLIRKFNEYYTNLFKNKNFLSCIPPSFNEREWGFIPIRYKRMWRHLSFQNLGEMKKFFLKNTPLHLYYSSAYYEHPDIKKMSEKGWKGADLIFDIDMNIKNDLKYEKMLLLAKDEVIKLYDILKSDFGLNDIQIVFSGGRGYHIHVRDRSVLKLKSEERREMIDYLSANSLNIDNVLKKREVVGDYGIERGYYYGMVDSSWGERVWSSVITFLDEIRNMNENDAIKKIKELKIGKRDKFVKDLSKKDALEMYQMLKKSNIVELMKKDRKITTDKFFKNLVERIVENELNMLPIKNTDNPVTTDIKRLIRLPGSLHGGTGFQAKLVDNIDNFDPLNDAIVFSDENKKIISIVDTDISMKDNKYKIRKDENKLPEFVCLFLICRGLAYLED